jgi:hypothetical protein
MEGKFFNHDLMLILNVIYPNFWVDHLTNVEMFSTNIWLSPIYATYFTPYKWGKEGVFVKVFVDGHALNKQCFKKNGNGCK